MRELLVGAMVTLVLTAGSMSGQGKTDPSLDKLAKEFAVAFNAKDAAKVAAFYAEDAVLMPPGLPMVKGRAGIEAHWKQVIGMGATNLQLRPMESVISGNQAFEAGTVTFAMKGGAGAAAATITGKYVVVYKRVGSDWKLAYDVFNEDQPAPPPQKK